jgi:predicted permease
MRIYCRSMAILDTIVPVFGIVAVGWWFAARRKVDAANLADIALLVTSPALLFSILAGSEIEPGRFLTLAGGAAFVLAGTGALALLWVRATGAPRRGVLLPAMLWNAGNMALPVCRLAFGPEGLEAAAIVFVVMATVQSSVGIWIAKGAGGLREALRLPLLHASLLGLLFAALGISLPRMIMEPIDMLGAMAIPLMLLNLGIQLRTLVVADIRHALAAVGIRIGGGFVLAWLLVTWLGLEGVVRNVLMVQAIMPAAVINVVVAQRYGANPALVASAIAIGTLASVFTIPALLWWLTL